MTLPAGISTCTVTFGKALGGALGTAGVITGTIEVDRALIWAATGDSLYAVAEPLPEQGGGGWITIAVPHVNQAGFLNAAGDAVTGFAYILKASIKFPGRTSAITVTKPFQVLEGQTNVDLDLVPGGTITQPVEAPTARVTSVAGETDAVTAEQLAAALNTEPTFLEPVVAAVVASPELATSIANVTGPLDTRVTALENAAPGGGGAATPLNGGSNVLAGRYESAPPQDTAQTSRVPHVIGFDGRGVALRFVNQHASASVTISAAFESGSAVIPVTFSGQPTKTLAPGASATSDFAAIRVTKGSTLWSRNYVPAPWQPNSARYGGSAGRGSKSTSNLTTAGSGAVSDTSTAYMLAPAGLIIQPATPGSALSVIAVGDSIDYGQGDSANTGLSENTAPDAGWINRALSGKAGVVQISLPGEAVGQFVLNGAFGSQAERDFRLAQAATTTDAFEGYGRNDLNAGRTAAQIKADKVTLWKLLVAQGVQRVWVRTLTPKTTAVTDWTTANQTIDATGGNAARVDINTWLRAGAPLDATGDHWVAPGTSGAILMRNPLHPAYGLLDVAAAVESGSTGKWVSNYTSDGQHPNDAGYTAMAALVNPDALG